MVRVHFGPPMIKNVGNVRSGFKDRKREFKECQNGLESRLLKTVQWTVLTGVAFPQKSESIDHRYGLESGVKRRVNVTIWGYSSAGRALEWHSRGQRFDPAYLHHLKEIDWSTFENKVLHWVSCEIQTMYLENWTLWLWCNYEKATVKEIFSWFWF